MRTSAETAIAFLPRTSFLLVSEDVSELVEGSHEAIRRSGSIVDIFRFFEGFAI